MLKSFVNCMKIKCKMNSFGSGIVVVFCGCHHHLYRYSMMTVSVGVCIDTVPILTVSSQPYIQWYLTTFVNGV